VGETKARMREHDQTRDPNDMPPLRLVRTRLDDAPTDIEAQKYRMAAGAEHHEEDDGYKSIIEAARELHLAEEERYERFSIKGDLSQFEEDIDDDDDLADFSLKSDTDLSEFNETNIYGDESFMDHLS